VTPVISPAPDRTQQRPARGRFAPTTARPGRLTVLTALTALAFLTVSACTSAGSGDPTEPTISTTSAPASVSSAVVSTTGSSVASGSSASASARGSSTDAPTTIAFTSRSAPPRSSAPAPSAPKPSGTAAIGTLDARTTSWFTSLCTGLTAAEIDSGYVGTGPVEAQRSSAVAAFDKAATAYRTMADEIAGIGAPTIPGGEDLQQTLVATLPSMAAAADQASAAVAAAADTAGVEQAVGEGSLAVSTAGEPLTAFGEAMAAPALTVQVVKIPQCTTLFS